MPLLQRIAGEWIGVAADEGRWVEKSERDLHSHVLSAQSEIDSLIEYATDAAKDGRRLQLSIEDRRELATLASKITDLQEILPKPHMEAVR